MYIPVDAEFHSCGAAVAICAFREESTMNISGRKMNAKVSAAKATPISPRITISREKSIRVGHETLDRYLALDLSRPIRYTEL
jgi:hypothetical protein